MSALGYTFVQQSLGLSSPPPRRPALIKPIMRVERNSDHTAVPSKVAPDNANPLAHLLFGLKHEGVELAILMEALRKIPGHDVLAEIQRTPGGAFARQACFFWEQANGISLAGAPTVTGATVNIFDPRRYVTGNSQRDPRWRVNFNGLGSIRYCATVEKTAAINSAMQSNLLERVNRYAASLDGSMRDRALAWAYLHETTSSFAIEREVPGEDRQRAFVALLHQAHQRQPLSEDYLVALQNATITNPHDKAFSFRSEQNFLQGPLPGAAGVTYVPPPPAILRALMDELMSFANQAPSHLDPIVAGAISSFGFVFNHPFMDGNGRLSRFLVHHALCRSGALENGLILPVSIAMKHNEADYLKTLQAFSLPARAQWQAAWIDAGQYRLDYKGSPGFEIYRYWNATSAVEFCYRMAEQSLGIELRQNTEYLIRYDAIVREVDQRYDIRGNALSTLVMASLENGGTLSKRRKDQFMNLVPKEAFALIEQVTRKVLKETAHDEPVEANDDETSLPLL